MSTYYKYIWEPDCMLHSWPGTIIPQDIPISPESLWWKNSALTSRRIQDILDWIAKQYWSGYSPNVKKLSKLADYKRENVNDLSDAELCSEMNKYFDITNFFKDLTEKAFSPEVVQISLSRMHPPHVLEPYYARQVIAIKDFIDTYYMEQIQKLEANQHWLSLHAIRIRKNILWEFYLRLCKVFEN